MGKRERKIEVIEKYIKGAAKNWSSYTRGNIPKTQAMNAINSYAGAITYGDILGLIDTTVLGNGKKGMVFTEQKIYYDNGLMGSRGSVSYKEIYEEKLIPGGVLDSTYNVNAMKEMVSSLAGIEGENFDDTINEIGELFDNADKTITDIQNTVEKGIDLLNTIFGLFDSDSSEEQ